VSGRERGSGVDVGLWGALWAAGLLFHYARADDRWTLYEPVHMVAAGAFALLLVRPRWSAAWVLAAFAQLADALFTAVTRNDIQMSWTIVAAVHVAFLVVLARAWRRPEPERAQAALDALAPSLRGVVLLVYFYAVFHKLNAAYFAPGNPTPVELIRRMPGMASLVEALGLTAWEAHIGIGIEVVAFFLLAIPRLRLAGVLTAFALHFGLGWVGFRQFLIMFPLLLLFLRPAPGRLPGLPPRVTRVLAIALPPAMIVFLRANDTRMEWDDFVRPLFVFGGAVFIAEVVRRVRTHGVLGVGFAGAGPTRPLDALLPALFAVWCFLPYLGVTTHPCMTMYSRLSVHSGTSNHLVVPASVQIDAIQGDLVRIVDTAAKRTYPLGASVPRLSLRKSLAIAALRGRAPAWVTYSDGETRVRVERGRLPAAAWYERLPMVSFNGPSAMAEARAQRRRPPRLAPPRVRPRPPPSDRD